LSHLSAAQDDVCPPPCPGNRSLRSRLFAGQPWLHLSGPSYKQSCPSETELPDYREALQRSAVDLSGPADSHRVYKGPSPMYRLSKGRFHLGREPGATVRKLCRDH